MSVENSHLTKSGGERKKRPVRNSSRRQIVQLQQILNYPDQFEQRVFSPIRDDQDTGARLIDTFCHKHRLIVT